MRRAVNTQALLLIGSGAFLLLSEGCSIKRPKEQHFYDQHIQPIFTNFCASNTSPCHRVDATTGVALGNLDLSSFEGVQKRRDVLRTYGSYPQPLLLLKTLTEGSVQIPYQQKLYVSEIRHNGGNTIAPTSDAYYELKRWLDNGANIDGLAPAQMPNTGRGACNTAIPADQPVVDTTSAAYGTFVSDLLPKILTSCAFGTCHSSPQSDFYMTCGDDDAQKAYNYGRAASFVTAMGVPIEQSEILLRPLATAAGGVSHTGGVFFDSRENATWKLWKAWAEQVQLSPPFTLTKSPGQQFFEANVMPKLLQRGCALEGCHSPDGFNDFRLRSGAQGFFSPLALQRNYDALLKEFMALDTIDVKQSRAVKKTIFASSGGITHRAGPVLDGVHQTVTGQVADSADVCPAFDATTASAFCTVQRWHALERQDRAADVSPMASGDVLPLAFVARPANNDALLRFDSYAGGADLKLADAVLGADGAVTSVGNVRSALGGCPGLTGDLDVRGPEWSYDGTQLVFAARAGAASGLDLYLLGVGAGGTCRRLTSDGGRMQGLARVHNFDPVFAPDGSVVFASTRAGSLTLKHQLPNADLFRVGPDLNFAAPEQMTWLLNSEIGPAFMQDGRVSFTAEKATPDLYQLAGRRINWDRTDYHPLLAQRAQSAGVLQQNGTFTADVYPSVDYQQATEIREGLDRNFLIILSDADPAGVVGNGGALATFNRSIGPFEADRVGEPSYARSLVIVDPAATGRAGTAGVYRSPFSLPNGEILASYAGNVGNPLSDVPRYDLVAVAADGSRRMLSSGGTQSYVEAVLGYKRAERELFRNLPQLVFGGHGEGGGDTGVMHFPDLPVLATLLDANLRRGREVKKFDTAVALRVYEEKPPPSATPALTGKQMVYSERVSLGTASLEGDKSLKVAIPAQRPLILELIDGGGKAIFTMREEHQLAPGEYVTPGPPRHLFNGICGGCHGSLSGEEIDVAVTPDALTGASVSASREKSPKNLR